MSDPTLLSQAQLVSGSPSQPHSPLLCQSPLLIRGEVQHYQWGGSTFIPEILNIEQTDKPFAELWFGTHSSAPSTIVGGSTNLLDYIQANPQTNGGQDEGLHFLLKILDVRSPLSIQVHPKKGQAEQGFDRENRQRISLKALDRNYRDDNHKPEIMVALSTCYLLYGFSELQAAIDRYQQYPSLQSLAWRLRSEGFERFYPWLMRLSKTELQDYLNPLLAQVISDYRQGQLSKHDHGYWVARAALEHGGSDVCDPGLLAMLAMNLVRVEPGKGIFQPAQLPHAYLEGANVELMANSDNVLRGGLTPKHIDIEELLTVVAIEPCTPEIIKPQTESEGLTFYPIPTCEFSLYHLSGDSTVNLPVKAFASILLNIGEPCRIISNQLSLDVPKGMAAFIPAGIEVKVMADLLNCYLAC